MVIATGTLTDATFDRNVVVDTRATSLMASTVHLWGVTTGVGVTTLDNAIKNTDGLPLPAVIGSELAAGASLARGSIAGLGVFLSGSQLSGYGAPTVAAGPGATYTRRDGGASTTLYVKETAITSTTWRAV